MVRVFHYAAQSAMPEITKSLPKTPRRPASSGAAIIAREDGASIAYHRLAGRAPGVVFLTGFKSDMTGEKAMGLEDFCRRRGRAFLRFDYFGHGDSSGRFDDGTIGRWADDAVFAIDRLTEGPLVLVGSSMGGWLMLLTALARPERIAGLVGIATAPDFTQDLIEDALTPEQKAVLERAGTVTVPNAYDPADPFVIRRDFIDEGRNHLLLDTTIAIDCPVRLLHGIDDKDVPYTTSLRLAENLRTDDVEITLIKNGDHRLSAPADITRLTETLERLLNRLDTSSDS
jgi:pimeloyl-ACP methyl ester carboxylesterase